MDKIIINFNQNNDIEYGRQLGEQESGLNDLTVQRYLHNRQEYKSSGRSKEGNIAQEQAREMAYYEKLAELNENNVFGESAETQANEWLHTQDALHSPDQIAGGNPEHITGVGDKGVNRSLGGQWRHGRADELENHVNEQVTKQENTFREQGFEGEELNHAMQEWQGNTNLNVELSQGIGEESVQTNEIEEIYDNELTNTDNIRGPPETEQELDAEQQTETERELDAEQQSEIEQELDAEQETGTEQELDAEQQTGAEQELDTEQQTETEQGLDTEQELDAEQQVGTEQEVDAEQETGTEQELGAEQETGTEQEFDAEQETGIEQELGTEQETETEQGLDNKQETAPEENQNQEVDNSPSQDNDYDYYNGYGY